ncbi:SDR family oxidoreductase [Rapidithrix thailandica]|uniref:SDR family oxidoreductase n=1 Tax=Rapidithrix thailandica TaxID=413964 RepID=A0AAW9S5P5_9BACT
MDLNLKKKQAVVCGSTQGIGKAVALELASLGASVTLVARNEEKLQQVLSELDTTQEQVHDYLVADFQQPAQLAASIARYASAKAQVHILVNNTGGPAPGQAIDAPVDAFTQAFSAHLVCNQHLVQALAPLMKKVRYGRIINIISTSVKVPIPNLGVSNTIRGAVASWAKTLARELAPFGITVNNVLPGLTKTQRLDSLIANNAQKAGVTVEELARSMQEAIPAQRFAEASEVANAVAFLASPAAAFVNGVNLPVDGGNTPCL